jgi:predicted Ser/Thr protein kinase
VYKRPVDDDGHREIAGYRIEAEIGRGGMGVVYLATQTFPERKVALKVLSPDLASDPAFRERFVRESNAAASTEHPNIVPIYGAGESDGELYLAMRYVEGTDLRSLLEREGPLVPERAARICADIADALEAAHERGLIHRDVKPGNVLIDARDHAYLTDFGLIRRTKVDTGITKTGQFMGTIDYVAPEQIMGGELDGRADVYSLGCVLYECLTGSPPFRRDSEVATMYAHLHEAPASIDGSARRASDVAAVAMRAMAKRPDDRFATAAEMAGRLRSVRDAAPTLTTLGDRKPRRNGLVAAIALLIVGVLAFALSRGDEDATPPATTGTEAAVAPGTLVGIDPQTGEPIEKLRTGRYNPDVGDRPKIDVGSGSIWIAGGQTGLFGVDVDSGDVSQPASRDHVVEVLAAERLVWSGEAPGVAVVDPAVVEVIEEIRVVPPDISINPQASDLAEGFGGVWGVFADGTLAEISPLSFDVVERIDLPGADNIDVSDDDVLVTDKLGGVLRVIDPRTLEVRAEIAVSPNVTDIESGDQGVWVLDPTNGSVTEVDLEARRTGRSWDVGTGARDLDIGSGWIWVAKQDGTVLRIEPLTGERLVIDIGAELVAISVSEDPAEPVWVYAGTIADPAI